MYRGTAMNNRENGSWLGVMTAAKNVMPTAIHRRAARNWAVEMTRTRSRNTRSNGNSNATPNARNISITSVRYLSAVNRGWIDGPPTFSKNVSAGTSVNQ